MNKISNNSNNNDLQYFKKRNAETQFLYQIITSKKEVIIWYKKTQYKTKVLKIVIKCILVLMSFLVLKNNLLPFYLELHLTIQLLFVTNKYLLRKNV